MPVKLTTNFVSRWILLQNSRRLSDAVLTYQTTIKFWGKQAGVYLNLAVTYSDLGRKDKAIKILHKGSQLDDNGLKDPKVNSNARFTTMFHLGKLLLEAWEVKMAKMVKMLWIFWARHAMPMVWTMKLNNRMQGHFKLILPIFLHIWL